MGSCRSTTVLHLLRTLTLLLRPSLQTKRLPPPPAQDNRPQGLVHPRPEKKVAVTIQQTTTSLLLVTTQLKQQLHNADRQATRATMIQRPTPTRGPHCWLGHDRHQHRPSESRSHTNLSTHTAGDQRPAPLSCDNAAKDQLPPATNTKRTKTRLRCA